MRHLIDDVNGAIAGERYYAALALALALPDICGDLDPDMPPGSADRYAQWTQTYLTPFYVRPINGVDTTFLTGGDCYALRCAYLHQGLDDVTEQRARVALDRFVFAAGEPGFHIVTVNSSIILSVERFCQDVRAAVETWLVTRGDVPEVVAGLDRLLRIQDGKGQVQVRVNLRGMAPGSAPGQP